MAKAEVDVNVKIDGAKTLKDLKADLKQAQGEALALARQFGELSPQAQAAARRVAELRDEVADLNERVGLMDPGSKFAVFGNAVKAVVGGLTAAQGALAAFGAESEDLQKTLVKLQGLMALSEGLSTIADSYKDFQRLGTVIKGQLVQAFSTLKGAIIASGIGLLVVTLGLVIANLEKVEAWLRKIFPGFETFAKLFDKLKAVAMGALNAIIESFKVLNDIIVDIFTGDFSGAAKEAKNAGKRIGDAYVEGFEAEVADQIAEAARKATGQLIKQQENDLKVLRAYGATRAKEAEALELEIAKNKVKVIDASTKEGQEAQVAAFADYDAMRIQQMQKDGQRVLDALKNRQALQMQALQDAGKDTIGLQEKQLQAQLAIQKQYGLDTNATMQAILQAREADRKARFDKEMAALVKEQDLEMQRYQISSKNTYDLQQQNLAAQLALYEKYGYSLKEVQEKQAAEELARRKTLNDALQSSVYDHQVKLSIDLKKVAENQAIFNQKNTDRVELSERKKQSLYSTTEGILNDLADTTEYTSEIEQAAGAASAAYIGFVESQKQDAIGKTGDALTAAAKILGQQTIQGKAVSIAATTINTYESAMLAYRNGQMIGGPWGIAFGIASAAAAVIAGVANIRKIAAVKIPGAGGGAAAPSIPSSATSGISIPSTPSIQGSMVGQLDQINSNLQQPGRVYVVESDITDKQNRVAKIREDAEF